MIRKCRLEQTTCLPPRFSLTPKPQCSDTAFPIVGIGASAGGLEALEQLLAGVPADSGMAFVVIQHLDPKRPGMLPELLQRATTDDREAGDKPDADQAGLRLCHSARQGHLDPARRRFTCSR